MTKAFARFYGLESEFVKDRMELLRRPAAKVVMLSCDDAEEIEWLRQNAASFKNPILSCLSSATAPAFDRAIDVFARPLRPHLVRAYFTRISLGRIHGKGTFRPVDDPIPSNLGMHVLAVDDAPTNQLIIRQMLRKLGCTFKIAGDGQEAVDAIRAEHFDLVLLDQSMPVLDGPHACRMIRALENESANVPILAMTASNLQSDQDICHRAGMDGFLSKPVTLRQLGSIIQSWHGKRSSRRLSDSEF
jgi:CheY-like chemotaxis protein